MKHKYSRYQFSSNIHNTEFLELGNRQVTDTLYTLEQIRTFHFYIENKDPIQMEGESKVSTFIQGI